MQTNRKRTLMATRTIAYSALLVAISVVMARLLSFAPVPEMRLSLDKFPLFLAGMFFGPVAGCMVSFAADFIGCLFSPYGFNPIFSPTAIFYGLMGGLFRYFIAQKPNIFRLAVSYLFPVVLGSILYQSAALAWTYSTTTFQAAFIAHLGSRSIQFAVTLVLEVTIIFLLTRTKVFHHLGIWPPKRKEML